jgi:hypothetical protein
MAKNRPLFYLQSVSLKVAHYVNSTLVVAAVISHRNRCRLATQVKITDHDCAPLTLSPMGGGDGFHPP